MRKNTAGQTIGAQMVSATDGSAFTGSVTVYVTGDSGTQAAGSVGSGACTHEGNGYHTYAPAQAETNYSLIAFTFIGTGAVPQTIQVETIGYDASVANLKVVDSSGNAIAPASDLTLVLADTNELQTDWVNGGRLDLILDARASETNATVNKAAILSVVADVHTDVNTILTRIPAALFAGITSLAQWLGLIAGKQTGNSTARTELRATGAGSGTYDETTDSLQAQADAIAAGPTISIVVPAAVAAASQTANSITIVRGDTVRRAFTALGDLSTRQKLWFTIKAKTADADSAAIIQITEEGGLITFSGAASADDTLGSITVDDEAAGDITIYIDASITKQFGLWHGYVFDVQWLGTIDVTTPVKGTLTVTADVTNSVV